MKKCDDNALTEAQVHHLALSLLARREHSRAALCQRLIDRGADASIVDSVLNDLHARGYQSDERFIQSLVRVRISQGKGPCVLYRDAKTHCIPDQLLAAAIEAESPDWAALASAVLDKRFGGKADTLKEKGRHYRFLMMRGFEAEQIHLALNRFPEGIIP